MKTISIFGSCVTRDVMAILEERELMKHKRSVGGINPIAAVSASGKFDISEESIKAFNNFHFPRRNACLDINGKVFDFLFEEIADYIFIDTFDACMPMLKYVDEDKSFYITAGWDLLGKKAAENVLNIKPDDISDVDPITDITLEQWNECIDIICHNILRHYDQSQIILNVFYSVAKIIDLNNGNIYDFTDDVNSHSRERNKLLKALNERFICNLPGSHKIEFPNTVYGSSCHKWGLSPVHYWRPYYNYVVDCVMTIAKGLPPEEEKALLNKEKDGYERKAENVVTQAMICGIKSEIEGLRKQNERLSAALSAQCSNCTVVSTIVKNINDIDSYIDFLKAVSNKYLIIFAARGIHGICLPDKTTDNIRGLGYGSFNSSGYGMYVGIIYKGLVLCDNYSLSSDAPQTYKNEQLKLEVTLNDKTVIIIKDVNYMSDQKGLNFVTYDTDNEVLIDSIAYDKRFPERYNYYNFGFKRK